MSNVGDYKLLILNSSNGSIMMEPAIAVDTDFNIMEVCCTCLSKNPSDWLKNETANAYRNLTGIEHTNDLPNQICSSCSELLKQSDEFRTKCLESYEWLIKVRRHIKNKTTEVKQEIDVSNKNDTDMTIEQGMQPLEVIEVPVEIEQLIINKTEINGDVKDDLSGDNDNDNVLDYKDDLSIVDTDSDFDMPLLPLKKAKIAKKKIKLKKKQPKKDCETGVKKVPRKKKPGLNKRSYKAVVEDYELMTEYFEIKVLSPEEQKEEFSKRKETKNFNESTYKCEFCFKGFRHEKAFKIHMAKHSDNMGKVVCPICNRRCTNTRVLNKHMDHHRYTFSCKKCEYETKAKGSAKLHIDWHNGKMYSCDKCGQTYARISTLLSHLRIKHPSDHVCGLCGYSFLGNKGLSFHKQLKHKLDYRMIPPDGPKCDLCDIIFVNEDALLTHTRVSPRHGECKRNDAPPRDIKRLGDRIENRGRRPVSHMREARNRKESLYTRVNNKSIIYCEQCGAEMFSANEYRIHFNRYHPNCTRTKFPVGSKPSLCDICGKMFKTPAILNSHMTDHEDLPTMFKCDVCEKSFRKKSSLGLHMNIHKDRRYPCPICGKTFNQTGNRDRHFTYVHSSVKDVKCDYCEKFFKSDEEKKLHTTYVHFKKPYPKRSRGKRVNDIDKRKEYSDMYSKGIV